MSNNIPDFKRIMEETVKDTVRLSDDIIKANKAKQERQQKLDSCTFETLELFKQIQEDLNSEKELSERRRKIETKRFIITTIIGSLTLLAAVIVPFLV